MNLRFKAVFVAVTLAVGGLALTACAPASSHCVSSTAGTNPGDNTRSVLGSSLSGSPFTWTPGAHVTLDGWQSGSDTYSQGNQSSSPSSPYATVASGSGDQSCLANVVLYGASNAGVLKVDRSNFVTRDSSLYQAADATGPVLLQNADDLGLSFASLGTTNAGDCINRSSGDNIAIYDSDLRCTDDLIQGDWGTGSDHGIFISNSTLKSDYGFWFRGLNNTGVQMSHVTLVSSQNATVADLIASNHGYDVPSTNTSNCDYVDLWWFGTGTPSFIAAWQLACNHVTVHTTFNTSINNLHGGDGIEGGSIIRDGA